jgi:archaetidylinositol phosphate synthase
MTDRLQTNKTGPSRLNRGLLQPLEAVLLQKIVRKLPGGVTPDMLTWLGLGGAALTGVGYFLTSWDEAFLWLASFGLLVNWFGDSLDGTLARYRQIERPTYGFFVDHTTDIAAQLCIGLGLGLSPYVQLEIALALMVTYLAISCVAFIRKSVSGVLQISFYGNGPTEMRFMLIMVNMALFFLPLMTFGTDFGPLTLFDLGIMAICAGSLLLLAYMVNSERRALALRDPSPLKRPAPLTPFPSAPSRPNRPR